MDDDKIPEGCDTCPNRTPEKKKQQGKIAAYVFALIATFLLAFEAYEAHKQDKEIRIEVIFLVLPLVGVALGVNVEPETIGKLLGR